MNARSFFSPQQVERLHQAIKSAEKNTSGEIRIHIENHCKGDPVSFAEGVFGRLGMHKTLQHNGVLFFLAVKDKSFAIYGDKGIHEKVPQGFWEEIKAHMQEHFSKGQFTDGLCEGIMMAGEKLKEFFPFDKSDSNELSNEVTFQ